MKHLNTELNVSQICSIRTFRKAPYIYLAYEPEKRYLFFWKRPAGFYGVWPTHEAKCYTEEMVNNGEYNKNLYVDGGVVYYKPHVEITMSNDRKHTWYFQTEEELDTFLKRGELVSVNWI
jgi:hypothetical protein